MVSFQKIEKKWQKAWEEKKVFEPKVDKKRKKFFLTFPYPYMNAIPHIGHLYTLMRVEAFARYKRMKGFNVLFPQAWHCTGSPIVAAAKRIEEGEKKQIKLLKDQGFKDKEIEKLKKPEHWPKVFTKIWGEAYRVMAISYDKRREFITTSMNPHYDKFIQWQFKKLKEKGYVAKGKHPVVWDPKTDMPVGDHDRIKGEGEVPQEFCLFKFNLDDGKKIITATLRHDTVWGITNVYVNPEVEYVEIETKGERWIVGEPVIEKLKNQEFAVKVLGKVNGRNLIGKWVESFGGKKILVLPATFLDPNYGTGMVHSVPSDSADDLIALRDLQKDDDLIKEYGLNSKEVKNIEPIEIFETPEVGGNSAQYFLDKYNVKSQNERDKLEKIKKELYKLTFTKGKLGHLYKKGFSKNLEGMDIPKGQKIIKKELLEQGWIELFYELTGEVVSRSLAKCAVKVVSDQWFINYDNEEWKKQVHTVLKGVKLYPEIVRDQFSYVIGWLNKWACTREYGLGTRLPFDESWLIESLSDSTIYMAYYTIAHLIKDVPIEKVDDKLFDYIFLGKGGKPKVKNIDKMREEFEYWYPVDFRNSGKDLVQNHLTFFLFNHVAIFPKKYWPVGVGVNGWVKVDGQKMSKSLGNMIPVKEMAKKFGSDVSRLTILNGGEGLDDPNWDSNFAEMMKNKLISFYDFVVENYNNGRKDRNNSDNWIESKLHRLIKETEGFMENTMFRSAIQRGFFDLQNSLKRYLQKNKKPNKIVLNNLIETQLLLLSPFTPFICEEIWNKIGKKFISLTKWPEYDEKKIDIELEKTEEKINNSQKDIINIKNIVRIENPYTYLYPIPSETDLFEENKDFLAKTTGSESISVFSMKEIKNNPSLDPESKAKKAKPGKPGIYVSGTALDV